MERLWLAYTNICYAMSSWNFQMTKPSLEYWNACRKWRRLPTGVTSYQLLRSRCLNSPSGTYLVSFRGIHTTVPFSSVVTNSHSQSRNRTPICPHMMSLSSLHTQLPIFLTHEFLSLILDSELPPTLPSTNNRKRQLIPSTPVSNWSWSPERLSLGTRLPSRHFASPSPRWSLFPPTALHSVVPR